MGDADIEQLALAIAKALQSARSVSDSEHYDHHRWISSKIERENAWRAFWEEMRRHVIKWGSISVLSGLFYAAWLGFQQLVHK